MSTEVLTVLAGLGLSALALVAAVGLVRRATRERARLQGALRDLGVDLRRRLGDEEIDPHVAAAFNQTARDLEARLENADRAARRLRSLAALVGDRVAVGLDDAGEVREVVGDLPALTGHTAASVLGRHASFFFASEDAWDDLRAPGAPQGMVAAALRRRDGEIVQGAARVVSLDTGQVLVLAGEAPASRRAAEEAEARRLDEQRREQEDRERQQRERDLEQRELELEESRRQQEERLLTLLGALPEAVAIVIDGCIASVNRRFAELCRLAVDDLRGHPLTAFVAPRDLVRAAGFLSGKDAGGGEEAELTLVTQTGNEVTVAMRAGRADLQGRPALVLTARDVGARRDAERRLGLYSAWLGAALEASREGKAVLASSPEPGNWPLILANGAFLRALGLPSDHLPDGAALRKAVRAVFREGERAWTFVSGSEAEPQASAEADFETTAEPPRTLRIEISPVLDDGEVVGRLLSVRDVSERSRLSRRLRSELDELRSTVATLTATSRKLKESHDKARDEAAELDKLNRELRDLDEMKSNLLGNVSHELQTPLVSIKGYTEMILRGDLGPISAEQRQGLEVSRRNIQRLIGLIDQILTFTRTEERLAELTLESFPLWEVIEETISLLGDRIKQKALRVTTRYKTEELTVMADRDLVSQVIINLIGNAVKFNREGGEVAVSVRAAGAEELVVEIRDTGPGIPREEHERIFERGYRGASATGTRGSGIGLAVVREILRRHGCQIRVDSRPGEGTAFSFTLPLASSPDESPGPQPDSG